MSKFKFVLILVKSVTNQAIKANNQESAMLKFLVKFLSPAAPTFTVAETIEWNRLVSEAVKGQYESFSDKENLDWDLMVDEARFRQIGIPSTLAQAYAEMGMGSEDSSTWDVPLVCKGCGHVEEVEGMDDFCPTCQVDGTEFTLRGGYDKSPDYIHYLENKLSDKVDAACKGNAKFNDNEIPF